MRRSRQVLVAACSMAFAAATSVPVFAQPHSRAEPGRSLPVKKVQADNYRFCKTSETTCDTTADTNFKVHLVVGQKVKWIYRDTSCDSAAYVCPGHDVKFSGHHASGTVKTDGAVIYSTTFHTAGTYRYWCTHHKSQGMTGRIVVTNH
jgi:plastocyanin